MVLSRKKLKEKLRTLLADSSVNSESKTAVNGEEISKVLESVRERLKDSKPKVKRPRRKKKAPLLDGSEKKEEDESEGEAKEEKEKKEEKVEDKNGVVNQSEEKKTKTEEKKKKKQNQKKKKKQKEQDQSKEQDKIINETPTADKSTNLEKQTVELNQFDNLSLSEENSKKVYVGGIPYYSTEDDIKSFFETCGTVSDVDCMKFPETGKFRGIAILTFKTEAAAKRALDLDGSDMGGFFLKIQQYKGKSANKPDFSPQIIQGYNRIYVGNLAWDITEQDLKDFFKNLKIQSIRFGMDKLTGDFKGFAHVDFEENNSVLNALKLDQKMVKGRPVRIRCAVPTKNNNINNNNVRNNNVKNNGNNLEGSNVSLQEVEKVENFEVKEGQKKKKRRTCYECGMPGHLSSECPNKKNNDNNYDGHDVINQEDQGENNNMQGQEAQNKKKKRRTCYECGTPGHLSSECPNKNNNNNIDGNDVIMQEEEGNVREEEKVENTQMQEARKMKKNKRRTCYECGIPGHLSSECPNKKS